MTTRLIRTMVAAVLAGVLATQFLAESALAADTPEYWAGMNKDGNNRNSNARSIQGNLRVRWAQDLRTLDVAPNGQNWPRRRSYNLSVRDGRVLTIIGSADPAETYNPNYYVTYGIYSIHNGNLLSSRLSPMAGPNAWGDTSEVYPGLINQYWKADGTVYTLTGGDGTHNARFNPYTGERPFGLPSYNANWTGDASWIASTIDRSGLFAMSNSNPSIFATGNGGSLNTYSNTDGLLDTGTYNDSGCLPYFNGYLVEGSSVYSFKFVNPNSPQINGIQIAARQFQSGPFSVQQSWNYSDLNRRLVDDIYQYAGACPRAYCISEDNRVYYYAFNLNADNSTNYPSGESLVGVRTVDGVSDVAIGVPYDMNQEAISLGGSLAPYFVFPPQIATKSNYVVVFQAQQDSSGTPLNGHLFCFDTAARTLAWRHDYPAGYFVTSVGFPPNSAPYFGFDKSRPVCMTLAGDSAYVVEPWVNGGNLTLKADGFTLATGALTSTDLTPVGSNDQPIAVADPYSVSMRSIAAVDGTLVCLVDYDYYYQALAVIEGSTTPALNYAPVAVISAPATGTPMLQLQHLSDSPEPPTNQFDSGSIIAFNSAGSFDPNGGTLTYHWDFGNGATSAAANPSYAYPTLGAPGIVTNRTVTLTVTNSAGNSASVTRLLAINDVGNNQTLVYPAVADAYVYNNSGDSNYGTAAQMPVTNYVGGWTGLIYRGYVQFNLTSIVPSNIVSATLRLWVAPGGSSFDGVLNAYKCANTWNENTITWNNAPAPGSVVGIKTIPISLPQYGYFIDIPVTQYAKTMGSDGLLSFALDPADGGYFGFGTKEGGVPAQLLVMVGSSAAIPPAIATQPANQTVTAGQAATFSVAATGTAPLSYQWTRNGANIAGATNSSYTTPVTTTADNGEVFAVVVSNSGGTVTSSNATLTVNAGSLPPSITTQPASQTVTAGQTATFSIVAAGTAPLSYQWRKNGASIAGATGSSYTTPATTTADNGEIFTVVVSNSVGNITSNNATLTVNPGATATATYITTDAATQGNWKGTYGADGYAIEADSTNYPAYASVAFANNLLYTWTGSTMDLRALQKAASSTDRIAACWYNSPNFTIDVNLTDGQTHRVALYSVDWDSTARAQTFEIDDALTGTVLDGPRALAAYNGGKYVVWDLKGHVKFKLTCTAGYNAVVSGIFFGVGSGIPPAITAQPANQTVTAGQTATFNVVATGTAPLSYQWTRNGSNIAGANSSSYTTPATTTADSGEVFAVVVSNSVNSVTSSNATLTVNGSGTPATVVLQDGLNGYSGTRDTYLYKPWPTTVLGSQTTLYSDDIDSVLVRFPIFQSEGGPVPNGATIDSATLGLYKTYVYNYTGNAQRVLKNWVELEATWNNANATTPWSTPGASGGGTDILGAADGTGTIGWNPGWLSIDVSTGVKAFAAGTPNYGWYLSGVAGNSITFCSREFATDPTLRPKLTVTYHGGTAGGHAVSGQTALTIAAAPLPLSLTVSRLQGTANFSANGRDSAALQGVIPNLPVSFSPAAQTVLLSINGARATFTLDAKGRSKSAQGSFALKSGRFTAKLQNGTWSGPWGLDPHSSVSNSPLNAAVTLWLGGNTYAATTKVSCSTKARVFAKFKK